MKKQNSQGRFTWQNHKGDIMLDGKKTLFSGMQATGNLTLGNYLGALKNWVTISDDYQTFFSVVDMHSITVRQDPAELRRRARTLLTLYIAAGLDPEKTASTTSPMYPATPSWHGF